MSLSGKGAIVTGGASGIGWAAARALADEGMRVVVTDIDADLVAERAAELGASHLGMAADVSDEDAVDRMVSDAETAVGPIRAVINCAGMSDSFLPTVEQPVDNWRRLIDVHLTGTYLVSRRAARSMLETGGGAMVNVASIGGSHALVRRNAYTAAKHGIIGLTRNLGCEWAQRGLRVNAVSPGYIMTPMVQALIQRGGLDADRIRRRTPAGEFGTPEEVADVMVFLCSDKARYVTATVIEVDGGYTAYGSPADAAEI